MPFAGGVGPVWKAEHIKSPPHGPIASALFGVLELSHLLKSRGMGRTCLEGLAPLNMPVPTEFHYAATYHLRTSTTCLPAYTVLPVNPRIRHRIHNRIHRQLPGPEVTAFKQATRL